MAEARFQHLGEFAGAVEAALCAYTPDPDPNPSPDPNANANPNPNPQTLTLTLTRCGAGLDPAQLGSLTLEATEDVKPMSLSFLHRLVSSLTQAKMSNDRAQLAKGRALMSMPNFI